MSFLTNLKLFVHGRKKIHFLNFSCSGFVFVLLFFQKFKLPTFFTFLHSSYFKIKGHLRSAKDREKLILRNLLTSCLLAQGLTCQLITNLKMKKMYYSMFSFLPMLIKCGTNSFLKRVKDPSSLSCNLCVVASSSVGPQTFA